MIEWANNFGFADLIQDNLGHAPDIDVAELIAGVSEAGKGWWPVYGEQFHKPIPKPSKEAVTFALQLLAANWVEIVGDELASFTRPLRFTGRKYRRLVVCAAPEYRPPWGGWYSAVGNPRAFTRFRRAINDAILPLEVDAVDFATHKWGKYGTLLLEGLWSGEATPLTKTDFAAIRERGIKKLQERKVE